MKRATYRVPHMGCARARRPTWSCTWRRRRVVKLIGMDVGSTTVKAVGGGLASSQARRRSKSKVASGGRSQVIWQDYQRHNTRQAEKVLEFLGRMEEEAQVTAGRDRVFFTGSGAGLLGPLVGAKMVQEVVAVAACVERLHPDVRFVSEIGGEDMKTIFFTPERRRDVQAGLHAVGLQRRHRHLHREDRAQAPGGQRAAGRHALRGHEPPQGQQQVRHLRRDGRQHPREDRRAGGGDHREPLRGGGLPEPRHAHQGQYARRRRSCCSAGPTSSSGGCRRRGGITSPSSGSSARSRCPRAATPRRLHRGARGGALLRLPRLRGDRRGRSPRAWPSTRDGQAALVGGRGPARAEGEGGRQGPGRLRRAISTSFVAEYDLKRPGASAPPARGGASHAGPVLVGCDFGSTTAKAVVLSPDARAALLLLRAVQGQSHRGRPVALPQVREAGFTRGRPGSP